MSGYSANTAFLWSASVSHRGPKRLWGCEKFAPLLVFLALSATLFGSPAFADGSHRPWDKTGFFPCNVVYVFAFGWKLDEAKKCGADMGNAGDLQSLVASRGPALQGRPETIGCVGRDIGTCFWTISQTIALTGTPANPISIPTPKVDLYGKALDQDLDLQYGWFIGRKPPSDSTTGTMAIHITLTGNMVVKQIFVPLAAPIWGAKTVDDYDNSNIFEVSEAILGAKCVGPDRIAFYKILSEQMKLAGGGTDIDDDGVHHYATAEMTMCGYKLSIVTTGGVTMDGYYGGQSLFVQPLN